MPDILARHKFITRLPWRALPARTRCVSMQTICGPFSGVPIPYSVPFELIGQLSQRLSYRHIARGALHEGRQQSNNSSPGPKHTQTPAPPYDTSGITSSDKPNDNITGSASVVDGSTRDADDCGRRPSFVLVRCEANGAGPSARLLLKSCSFTPASWTAWCYGSVEETPQQTSKGRTEPLPSSQQAATMEADIGQPRPPPQWAGTAGDERQGDERPGHKQPDRATTEAILAALAATGPSKVLAKAFERVLDVEEDAGDDSSAANYFGTGDATRRVFDCVSWVYDHVRYSLG